MWGHPSSAILICADLTPVLGVTEQDQADPGVNFKMTKGPDTLILLFVAVVDIDAIHYV